ncbi:MAG TPA: recombinase RecA [Candidatus Cloacimonadota bacterium]|nr:recombinase RecA [Candidatus Cloacimonadota bacterium]HOH79795.1 recombinase RecA [Candidatus Cloacimonadota bacterium]HPN41504.1 recombinase RecA [Candidatus Cloacimonadota bacterium]
MDKNKESALKTAVSQLEKKFGLGTIMRLGDKPEVVVQVIPTGAFNLDLALGIGGIPKGRITEIYGAEASGKTTIALHVAAEAQKQGGVVAFIDAEHALDIHYAKRLGVQTDDLLLSQPDGGEQALEVVETLVRSSAVDLVIVDSVAALVPRQEIEGEMGDSHVGLQARLMSQALRKLTAIVSKSNTAVIFINQTRMKIGVPAYVNPETTTGGVALKFYSSVRLEVRFAGAIKIAAADSDVVGAKTRVKVVKNKFAPPFKTVVFPIIFGEGISHLDIIMEMAIEMEIIKKSGSWFSYEDTKIGQGAEKAKLYLKENPPILAEVEARVKDKASPELIAKLDDAEDTPQD